MFRFHWYVLGLASMMNKESNSVQLDLLGLRANWKEFSGFVEKLRRLSIARPISSRPGYVKLMRQRRLVKGEELPGFGIEAIVTGLQWLGKINYQDLTPVILSVRRGWIKSSLEKRIYHRLVQILLGYTYRLAGGGQADEFVAFELGGREFEFPKHPSTSSFGSPLLAAASFLKNDLHRYFIKKGSKRWRHD